MPPPPVLTTAPRMKRNSDGPPEDGVPLFALVVLASKKEAHRVGEVAFLKPFTKVLFGREHLGFQRQVPGERLVPGEGGTCLAGDSLSRRELELYATAVDVEMKPVGRWPVLVNGEVATTASLVHGSVVDFEDEVLLGVVRRPTLLPEVAPTEPIPSEPPKVVELRQAHSAPPAYVLQALGEPDQDGIVGETFAIYEQRRETRVVAQSGDHVLIQGESGAGKEMVAASIHRQSPRAAKPFVSVNATSFTTTLLDSELCGNLKNYPNPGTPAREGVLGAANGGTLFLDEVGDMDLELQTRLLRAMSAREIRVQGEGFSRPVDVRLVGATHREDDALRFDVRRRFEATVRVPPLRERIEDTPLLIRHLLRARMKTKTASPRELRFFAEGPSGILWPRVTHELITYLFRNPPEGNVRHLRELLIHAMNASPGDTIAMPPGGLGAPATLAGTTVPSATPLPLSDTAPVGPPEGTDSSLSRTAPMSSPLPFPDSATGAVTPGASTPPRSTTDTADPTSASPVTDEGGRRSASGPYSREELIAFLERDEWNVSRVARRLGVHRNTLIRWMRAHGIMRDDTA